MSSDYYGGIAGEMADDYDDFDDDEYCEHDCGAEGCFEDGFDSCHHQHCINCGGCRCPGYCDDYQTYNLRPAETGGTEAAPDTTGSAATEGAADGT
jgi:hypothetical protein